MEVASRRLSCLWIFLFLFCCCSYVFRVEASRRVFLNPSIASKEYRTAYHFQPPGNWINDPNGPMYYNGIYHLFYQYNPNAAVWGNISWAHSVSIDLINWIALDLALSPTDPFDINGCWSGSATILPGNKPVILYTGGDTKNHQVQNIAFPKNQDPFLREWTKPAYNPVMKATENMNGSQFRDPTTGWLGPDGYWRVAVGGEISEKGLAFLYKSKDFEHWVRAKDYLYHSNGSRMWECPDFYPVSLTSREGLDTSTPDGKEVKHVLKMSLSETRSDHYMLGRYMEDRDVFVPDDAPNDYRKWLRYDYGSSFYASKSFFDVEKKRRVLWSWSQESDPVADDIAKGWSGIQTAPRVIWLADGGKQLIQWPIKELESLRKKEVSFQGIGLKTGALFRVKGIQTSQADVEVEFELPSLEGVEPLDPAWLLDPQGLCGKEGASVQGVVGPFGLLVLASYNLQEHTAVFFRVFKGHDSRYIVLMCADLRRSSFRTEVDKPTFGGFLNLDVGKEGKISLKTLIDHSVIESFGGGGRTCITARVYPTFLSTGSGQMYAFNNGTKTVRISELKAWSMAKARID